MRTRALSPFLQNIFPETPLLLASICLAGAAERRQIMSSDQPGRTGLTIGNPGVGMVSSAVLGETGVLYDLDKFFYLGSPYSTYHPIFVSRKPAGLSSIEKLRAATGVRIGAQSVGFSVYNEARLFAYIIGLKEPKFVTGYAGPEIDQALIRGEVDARSSSADTVMQRNRDGSKRDWWIFMRSWKFPKATSILSSAIFPSLRASPGRIASVNWSFWGALSGLPAPPSFFRLEHPRNA